MANKSLNKLNRRKFLLTSVLATGVGLNLTQCGKTEHSSNNTNEVALFGAQLKAPARRIVLAQSRLIPNLHLVDPDIVNKLVGWSQDFKRLYPSEYQKWLQLYPQLAQTPIVGDGMTQTLSTEKILSLKPDLVIYSRPNIGPASNDHVNPDFKLLSQAGIAILVVDFFQKPLEHTIPSLNLIAQALDTHSRTQQFIALYQQKLAIVTNRIKQQKPNIPKVFMHAHAGSAECCFSVGNGVFHEFITTAGGYNLAADILKTPTGQIAKEYVFSLQPDFYLASGTSTKNSVSNFIIGPDVTPKEAQSSLIKTINAAAFNNLTAAKKHQVYGFWHAFNDSIAHIVLIEVMAQWFHPQLFADLDPLQTLKQINATYLTPPLTGTFWIQA